MNAALRQKPLPAVQVQLQQQLYLVLEKIVNPPVIA
jgi:hypothetical protein